MFRQLRQLYHVCSLEHVVKWQLKPRGSTAETTCLFTCVRRRRSCRRLRANSSLRSWVRRPFRWLISWRRPRIEKAQQWIPFFCWDTFPQSCFHKKFSTLWSLETVTYSGRISYTTLFHFILLKELKYPKGTFWFPKNLASSPLCLYLTC